MTQLPRTPAAVVLAMLDLAQNDSALSFCHESETALAKEAKLLRDAFATGDDYLTITIPAMPHSSKSVAYRPTAAKLLALSRRLSLG